MPTHKYKRVRVVLTYTVYTHVRIDDNPTIKLFLQRLDRAKKRITGWIDYSLREHDTHAPWTTPPELVAMGHEDDNG